MGCIICRVSEVVRTSEVEMMEDEKGICSACGQLNTFGDDWSTWCTPCNSQHFADAFPSWSSGNEAIDEVIRKTQLEASHYEAPIEWIPHHQFTDITFVAEGGFGKVHKAIWLKGPILCWDLEQNWWHRWSIGLG